jgi:hypothetical protein
MLATQKRSPAQNAQLPAEEVCFGCKSAKTSPWCTDCAIKRCAQAKGFESCIQCADIPCEQLTRFVEDPQWPYHLAVPKNWAALRQLGAVAWLRDQDARWRCPACGSQFAWRDETCPTCGKPVANYTADL